MSAARGQRGSSRECGRVIPPVPAAELAGCVDLQHVPRHHVEDVEQRLERELAQMLALERRRLQTNTREGKMAGAQHAEIGEGPTGHAAAVLVGWDGRTCV